MYYVFNKSAIGYSHLKNKKPCQDFSSSYSDNERLIITCCDGHGGKQYVRSQTGSRLASDAVINVFKKLQKKSISDKNNEDLLKKIKLLVLCEYNRLIEIELAKHRFKKRELEGLKEEEIDTLRFQPAKAYGTTLSGAMIYAKKVVVISIGDTETLGVRKGELIKLFDNSNDPAGNITYSMCQEDVYQYLRIRILDEKELDAVILCTDGLSSPYQSYDNFFASFIKPSIRKTLLSKSINSIDKQIDEIASVLGVGDDVSMSMILSDKTNVKYYR